MPQETDGLSADCMISEAYVVGIGALRSDSAEAPQAPVLDRAGVKAGAVQVRFNGLDQAVLPDAPKFMKSLAIDHAGDGEVMIAYAMNGEPLPLLNGFPLRLVVPGWYSTYWVKMLNDIEVLDRPDDNYWTKTAYTIPDTPHADIKPGEAGVTFVPIK